MGMRLTTLQGTDRIVEVNGVKLFVHDDYRSSRRNVACTSREFAELIQDEINGLDDIQTSFRVGKLIHEHKDKLDDLEVTVKGYY